MKEPMRRAVLPPDYERPKATRTPRPIETFVTTRRPMSKVRSALVQDATHQHEVIFLQDGGSLVIQVDGKVVWHEPENFTLA